MRRAGRSSSARGRVAGLTLLLGALALGCPGDNASSGGDSTKAAATTAPPPPTPEQFRREAHQKALAVMREQAQTALRALDPVATAEVEGAPLRPPGFGAAARAARREALTPARREAAEIDVSMLSPDDAMVLRTLEHALMRGHQQLVRPPWRDDPRAVLFALEPYLEVVDRRMAARACDDGCGLPQLAESLKAGFAELGSAPPSTLAAAREDLTALRQQVTRWTADRPPTHALSTARADVEAALGSIDTDLAAAQATLPEAPELPWARPVAPAAPPTWKRRPDRWDTPRLRHFLEHEEALGQHPEPLFEQAIATLTRLQGMQTRDAERGTDGLAIPRPLSATSCASVWDPVARWTEQQGSLTVTLDCAAVLPTLPPDASDAELRLQLIRRGIIEPTRRARLQSTAPDIALVWGRAAAVAQQRVIEIAITAGNGATRATELHALALSRQTLCLAATAVWIHGELGDDAGLVARLSASGCEDLDALIAAAEARPRRALTGLGLTLIGAGPADAAALDRFYWAPMGLVRDLAIPPPPPAPVVPPTRVEPLDPDKIRQAATGG